jgi:hypothetical protein
MKKIADELKLIYADIEQLNKFIESDYGKIKVSREMRAISKKLIDGRNTQSNSKKKANSIDSELKSNSNKSAKLISERENFLKSKEYMHFERLKDERETIAKKKNELLNEIRVQVTGAEKLIRSYLHETQAEQKADEETINEILADPRLILSGFSVFESVLKKAAKAQDKEASKASGKKKRKKSPEAHSSMIENLKVLVSSYEETAGREGEVSKELRESNFAQKLTDLNSEIARLEERRKDLMEEREDCQRTISKKYLVETMKLENYLSELAGEKIKMV